MQAPKCTNEVFRIFVGGLSYEVDNHLLKESFLRFSNLKKALVIRDQKTGQSKGYGFVTFSNRASFESALHTPVHIHGRLADCHPVLTKGALKDQEQRDISHKLFVGGISQSVTNEDLRRYFVQFGRIRESRILYDGKTGKSRGFGFVLFESWYDAENVLSISVHKIKKKQVEIKRFGKEKEEEFESANNNKSMTHHPKVVSGDQQAQGPSSHDPQFTTVAKPRRKKAQKAKQNSLESLSTISEKAISGKEAQDSHFSDIKPHLQSQNYPEEDSYADDLTYQRQLPLPSTSKPNFTLSGFFSYTQSFEPFNCPISFSRSNRLDPMGSCNLPLNPAWYCSFNPDGSSWTPSSMAQGRMRQSRPDPTGNYKY